MTNISIDNVLAQLRTMAERSGVRPASGSAEGQGTDFAAAIKHSIDRVNERQQRAGDMAKAFELGDPNVRLSEVMIEMQKARVSFEALSQVRNKLISAYKEIMNMQV